MKYSYLLHIFLPIIAAGIINLIIYLQEWNKEKSNNTNANKNLPPGYVIAIVWTIILGLLGYAHYLVYPSYASYIILLAIIYCLLYPIIVINPNVKNVYDNLFNFIALVLALLVCILAYKRKSSTLLLTLPFVIWTLYVNIVTNL